MLETSIKQFEELISHLKNPALGSGEFGKGVETGLQMAAEKLATSYKEVYAAEQEFRNEEIAKWSHKFETLTKQVEDLTKQNQDLAKKIKPAKEDTKSAQS